MGPRGEGPILNPQGAKGGMAEAPQDLGDGLVLRFARAEYVDPMVVLFTEHLV